MLLEKIGPAFRLSDSGLGWFELIPGSREDGWFLKQV
jgi:hypothetical protein